MSDTIETKVDKLVEYIFAKGEVSSSAAADTLDIPIEMVEEWAKPLEESDIIQIKYSPLHGMILVSKPVSKKEFTAKLVDFKNRKEELKREEKRTEKAFVRYGEELPELYRDLKEMEGRYSQKTKEAKTEKSQKEIARLLNDLSILHNKLKDYERQLDGLQSEKNEVSKIIDDFKKDLNALEKKAALSSESKDLGAFYDFLAKAENDLMVLKKKENKFIEEVSLLRRKTDELLPKVQLSHKEMRRKNIFNIFKKLRFWRKE
jgi:chromosome segregation ATPase